MVINKFTVGYVLSALKRAYLSNSSRIEIHKTQGAFLFVNFLYINGFILTFKTTGNNTLLIFPKYHNGRPLFGTIALVSVPSKRVVKDYESLSKIKDKISKGFIVCSTDKGYMLLPDCVAQGLGGEVVCYFK